MGPLSMPYLEREGRERRGGKGGKGRKRRWEKGRERGKKGAESYTAFYNLALKVILTHFCCVLLCSFGSKGKAMNSS